MTIDQILIAMRQAGTNAYSWSLPRREAEVLVAEVERLRAEVVTLRGERAAVVAWLRDVGCRMNHGSEHEFVLLSVADAVQNGEHRREEKP